MNINDLPDCRFLSSELIIVCEKFNNLIHRAQKNMLQSLLILLVLINSSFCYSIQGNWSLLLLNGKSVSDQSVVLNIADFVFRNQSILQKLAFSGCQQMLIQAQISQDQLFFNTKSYSTQPIPGKTCPSSGENISGSIFSNLATVFFFKINIDSLEFNDPYGGNVLVFKRLVQTKTSDISGVWNLNQYGNTRTSLSVEISPTKFTLCQGNLVYTYKLNQIKNIIEFSPIISNCPSQELTAALTQSKYFRIRNGILDLYDSKVGLSMEFIFANPYDASKPLFPVATPPSSATKAASAVNSQPSTSSIAGNWAIAALFNIPLPSTSYSLTITPNTIRINGGCNTFTYQYTINSTSQLIVIGNQTSTNKSCGQSDDQLYVSGILKMYKYLISGSNGIFTLRFYDQTGNPGYTLSINQNQGAQGSQAKPAQPSSPNQTPLPLTPGTYLLLNLQRRDIPRALVNVTEGRLTYKSCNTIVHTFEPKKLTSAKGSIKITGSAITSINCTVNNDYLYMTALNSAVTYVFDPNAKTIIFSNQGGTEVVTLSQAS